MKGKGLCHLCQLRWGDWRRCFFFFFFKSHERKMWRRICVSSLGKGRQSVFRSWGRCRLLWIWECEEIHLSISDRKASAVMFKGTGFLEPRQGPGGQEAAFTFPRRRSLRKTAKACESNLLEKSAWNLKPRGQPAGLVCSWVVPLVTHLTDRGVSQRQTGTWSTKLGRN